MVPQHLGIIMDGNRRWAKAVGLPSLKGHQEGFEVLKRICYAAIDRGIEILTFYAFSTENWNRTPAEVKYMMELALTKAVTEIAELDEQGIRFRFVGSRTNLSKKLLAALDHAEAQTAGNTRGTLAICFNYGGAQELADAAADLIRTGITPANVTPELLAEHLYAPDLPPLDLIIRTSGEHRLSGFMLGRAAYAELYFVEKHWPDFTAADLDAAVTEYASRMRRFGR